jgi:hypothetical protein
MRALRHVFVTLSALAAIGCEAIVDYNGYIATPADCDPVHPLKCASCALRNSAPRTFVSCDQQCGRRSDSTFGCINAGAGVGTQCASDTDCAAGYGCDGGTCRRWCSAKSDCDSGQECDPSDAKSRGNTLGFCATPCDVVKGCGEQQCSQTKNGPRCTWTVGAAADYDPCTSDHDCKPGSGCQTLGTQIASTNPPAVQRCQRWCNPSASACAANEACVAADPAGYCYAPCNVLAPESGGSFHACAAGQRCSFVAPSGGVGATVCEGLGKTVLHEDNACSQEAGCDPKVACRGFAHGLFCVGYCKRSNGNADCAAGRTCKPFTTPRRVHDNVANADLDYGFCQGPSCDPRSPQAPSGGLTACGAGETCMLHDDEYATCRAQTNPTAIGKKCDAQVVAGNVIDPCQPGSECVGSEKAGYFCRAYCRLGKNDCAASKCAALATTFTLGGESWGYCPPPPCDPMKPTNATMPFVPCMPGEQCRFASATTTTCVQPTGNTNVGGTCTDDTDCRSDALCVHFTNNNTCLPSCRVGTNNDCTNPSYPICYGFKNQAYFVESQEYGYCGAK